MSITTEDIKVQITIEKTRTVKEIRCDKCGKIVSRGLLIPIEPDLNAINVNGVDTVPLQPYWSIVAPWHEEEQCEPVQILCKGCYKEFENWLNPPVPEAPTPIVPDESITQEQADQCEGCEDYSNWKGHKRWKGKDCTCSTCRYNRPNTVTPVSELSTPPVKKNPCEVCKGKSEWERDPKYVGRKHSIACSTCLHSAHAEITTGA